MIHCVFIAGKPVSFQLQQVFESLSVLQKSCDCSHIRTLLRLLQVSNWIVCMYTYLSVHTILGTPVSKFDSTTPMAQEGNLFGELYPLLRQPSFITISLP